MPVAEFRGGAESALLQYVEASPDPGCLHVVFLDEGPMVSRIARAGASTSVVKAGRLRQPRTTWAAVRRIGDLARRERATAVIGWMTKAHLYGGPAARLAGVPALWFQHGLPDSSWRGLDRWAARVPTAGVLACSGHIAEAQRRGAPHLPVRVAYAPADLARFDPGRLPSPAEARRRVGVAGDGPLVVMAGRLQRWKGAHVLLEAMPHVIARHPGARVAVVGGDWPLERDYGPALRRRAALLGLAGRSTFAGQRSDVPLWMRAADVVVHASDREPFGMVVVEAMALGKPVVAGAEGGPREIITDGVDGLLAPFGDPAALASAVLRYLDDPAFATRAGAAARARAADFSAARFAERVDAAVAELVELAGPPGRAGRPGGGGTA